jgi:hypothetical protein
MAEVHKLARMGKSPEERELMALELIADSLVGIKEDLFQIRGIYAMDFRKRG